MYKIRGGVISHTSSMQRQCCIAKLGGAYARDSNVDGHRLHMQTVTRHAMSVHPEILIAPRGSITAHDIDLSVGTSERNYQIMQQVKNMRIVLVNGSGAVITQVVIQLRKSVGIIAVPPPVHDVKSLARVCMKKVETI